MAANASKVYTFDVYPWTHHIEFVGVQQPDMISIQGFRTLLENTYDIRLAESKKTSYVRSRKWLQAIWQKDPTPPKGYTGTEASWRYVALSYSRGSLTVNLAHPIV